MKREDPTLASFNQLYGNYRRRAAKHGVSFSLTKAQFRRLTKSPCFYCGRQPHRSMRYGKNAKQPYIYTGIDRRNNSRGYTSRNSVPACAACNYSKLERGELEFMKDVIRAAAFMISHRVQIRGKR